MRSIGTITFGRKLRIIRVAGGTLKQGLGLAGFDEGVTL
jgi:hypothetical protein